VTIDGKDVGKFLVSRSPTIFFDKVLKRASNSRWGPKIDVL